MTANEKDKFREYLFENNLRSASFLENDQHEQLFNEEKLLERFKTLICWKSNQPYPVDKTTSEIIRAARQHEVLPLEYWISWHAIPWMVEWHRCNGTTAQLDEDRLNQIGADLCKIADQSGVKSGTTINLSIFPLGQNFFARGIPLVDDVWIDRGIIELVEWWTTLLANGHRRLPPIDRHPLAYQRVYRPGCDWRYTQPVEMPELVSIRNDVHNELLNFRGKWQSFENRRYFYLSDYIAWRKYGNPTKEIDLREEVDLGEGIVISSWNAALDEIRRLCRDLPVQPQELPHSHAFPEVHEYRICETESGLMNSCS